MSVVPVCNIQPEAGTSHYPPWTTRTFSPIEAGSIRGSILALASTALGAGCLTTPYAFSRVGWVLGTLILISCGFMGMMTTYLLIAAVKIKGATSYSDLVAKCLGRSQGLLVDLLCACLGVGCVLSYMTFIGGFMPAALSQLPVPAIAKDRTVIMCTFAAIAFLLSTPPKISALRNFAMIPISAILLTACTIVFNAYGKYTEAAANGAAPVAWNLDWGVFSTNSIFMFAFMQHLNVCSVGEEMRNPTDPRIAKVCLRAALLEMVCYIPIALFGYLSFLGGTQQNVVNNYPANDSLVLLCRILLGCGLLVACPMTTIATGKAIRGLLQQLSTPAPPTAPATASTAPATLEQPLLDPEANTTPSKQQIVDNSKFESAPLRIAVVACIIGLCLLVGLQDPPIALVVGLMGGLFGTTVMCVYPLFIYMKTLWSEQGFMARAGVVGVCVFYTVVGYVATVFDAMEAMKPKAA